MTGFFYDIRGQLQTKYSGRYLALLLREIARHEPKTFLSILKLAKKHSAPWRELCKKVARLQLAVECEVTFDGASGRRRADLALLDEDKPVLFVEVKEDDIKNPGNSGQLKDYLVQARGGIPFIHLSRFALDLDDREAMERVNAKHSVAASVRYRDIYTILPDRPLANMLREYLEDISVGTYVPIRREEDRPAAFLLTQMLGFPHAQGLGRLHAHDSVAALPKLLQRMFDNLEFVAEWLRQENLHLFGQRFTRKLLVEPEYDLIAVARAIGKDQEKDGSRVGKLPGKRGQHVQSGHVLFYAVGRIRPPARAGSKLRKNDWLYVEVGFGLYVSRGRKGARKIGKSHEPIVRSYIYTGFFGNMVDEDETYTWTPYLKRFPNERQALKKFQQCLEESVAVLRNHTNSSVRAAVKTFRVPAS